MPGLVRIVCLAVVAKFANAHFSMTDISQIACDHNAKEGANWLGMPLLEGQPYSEWWMHGQVNCQYKAKRPFNLIAGGEVDMIMSSRMRKVPPPYGFEGGKFEPTDPDNVYSAAEWGDGPQSLGNKLGNFHNIHAYARGDTSGCAFAIAYKTDAKTVKPEDFVIFTVVHDCPKRQREKVQVPNLPVCPGGNCICAWFWIPKNSGTKNFYMTPFVCKVTGDVGTSPVDVSYATPPRRCLDPELCNFGPRQPMYWLGTGKEINSPENTRQSPHYSIVYGFREGAQHDIFESTNPWRNPTVGFPNEAKCNGAASRLLSTKTSFTLKSPDCKFSATLSNGELRLSSGWRVNMARFGPDTVIADTSNKASAYYFPRMKAPYRIDMNNKGYLALTDNNGMVLWESPFKNEDANKYIIDSFKPWDPDPVIWENKAVVMTPVTPTPQPPAVLPPSPQPSDRKLVPNAGACDWGLTSAKVEGFTASCSTCAEYTDGRSDRSGSRYDCVFVAASDSCFPKNHAEGQGMDFTCDGADVCNKEKCESWCNTPGKWGCGSPSIGGVRCSCDLCTTGNGFACNPDADAGTGCKSEFWSHTAKTCGLDMPCRVLAKTRPFDTCTEYCALQGHACSKAFEDSDNTCTGIKETVTCDTKFYTKYTTSDMICECSAVVDKFNISPQTLELKEELEAKALNIYHEVPPDYVDDGDMGSASFSSAGLVSLLASVMLLLI